MSLPVWPLSIVIDGDASSDRSLGPMLVWVCLGLFCVLSSCVFITSSVHVTHNVCIVLGSSLVFLVFCYMLIGRKRFIIFILSQHLPDSAFVDFALVCRVDVSFGILNVRVTLSAVGFL